MSWPEIMFKEKAHIFLRIMNKRWSVAPLEAAAIEKILLRFDFPRARILDLMCGNGRLAVYLAEKGYEVIGVDFSKLFIEDAKKRARLMGVSDKTEFLVVDIRNLYERLKDYAPFDVVLNFWTSIGYYGEEVDFKMFKDARKLVNEGGILIIADTISKESLLINFNPSTYSEFDDIIVLHNAHFDPIESVIDDLWRFYEKRGSNLFYLDSVRVRIRVYSISEIKSMLKKAGWKVIAAYDSIFTLEPAKKFSEINIVAKAVMESIKD